MAAQGDNPNMIIYFKDKYNFDIYSQDQNGSTPLHWACYNCSENAINFLLSFMNNINIQDKKGQTPLHIAIFTERVRIIKKLLYKGSDLTLKDIHGKNAIKLAKELTGSSSKITSVLLSQKNVKQLFYGGNQTKECTISNPLTFSLLFILFSIIVYLFELSYLPKAYSILFCLSIICFIISFIVVCISNPGIIKDEQLSQESWLNIVLKGEINVKSMCPYCKVKKLKLSKHCFICGHCIKERDHHCNVLGNCIAGNNVKFYLLFLIVFLCYVVFSYYVSLKVFLIKEATMNNKSIILPFYFLYRKSAKDLISILVMTCGIFFFGLGIFLFIKQLRQLVIMKKLKNE